MMNILYISCDSENNDPFSPSGPAFDARLSALTTSAGPIAEAFAPDNQGYSITVANAIDSISVIPTAMNTEATIHVWGVGIPLPGYNIASGTESPPLSLSVGENRTTVEVTSPNERFSLGYTIIVTRVN